MSHTEPLLEVLDLSCSRNGESVIFSKVNFTVNSGDVIVLRGKSGAGKTTLLKCLAHLNLYEGVIRYRGRTPPSVGIPSYRTRVLYVPQRPSLLPGTPRDFLLSVTSFGVRRRGTKDGTSQPGSSRVGTRYPVQVASEWGIDETLWDRDWTNLSGGESQRIALAVAVGLNSAEILLLDEPTSALDMGSSLAVEQYLVEEMQSGESMLKAMVWITHSEEQGARVGTRVLRISAEGCSEEVSLLASESEV